MRTFSTNTKHLNRKYTTMNKFLVTKTFKGTVTSPQHPDGLGLTFKAGESMFGEVKGNVLTFNKTVISGVKGNLHNEQ